ncbi:MAG TPA: M23 family metallopeptidase [Symbiobacteriaceae bacterium]|nr:M23 family metallopeptidase [Symbiobacteriaceae bacterium]
MKPGYRRAAVGVVGCLLVGGALGTTPHQGAAIAAASRKSPPAASQAAFLWEPTFDGDTVRTERVSAYLLSTRFLRPAAALPSLPALETYLVQDGDTLSGIAEAYDTDTATLQALNDPLEADALSPGQALKVVKAFHGLTYTVQNGDTLAEIALANGVTAEEIRLANGLQLDAGLREGEMLFLPGARPRSRMVVSRSTHSRPDPRPAAADTETPVVAVAAPKPAPVETPAPAPAPAVKVAAAAAAPPPKKPATDSGWVWPIVGGLESSEFGWRADIGDFHEGLDIAVPAGTPAVAARGGEVIEAGWDGGYGICVKIDHGDGTISRYAHASALLVSVGETVEQGQAVIRVGSTGHSTGNHLHFEIIVNGTPQDPRNYLP